MLYQQEIDRIARDYLGVQSTEIRGGMLDKYELHLRQIRWALYLAYKEGRESVPKDTSNDEILKDLNELLCLAETVHVLDGIVFGNVKGLKETAARIRAGATR